MKNHTVLNLGEAVSISIIYHIDLIYGMIAIFIFDGVTVKTS